MFHAIYSKIKKIFFKQEIFFATNSRSSKKFFKAISKYKRIFVVTGKRSYITSGSKKLVDDLLKNNDVLLFDDFDVNPDIKEIKIGTNFSKKFRPDLILAVGGGSVIDAAKVIHVMTCNDLSEDDIFTTNQHELYKTESIIPLFAIPTTAGTGSESTHFAVLYKNKKKFSIAAKDMVPSMVYLEPNLCLSNSPYQNACSGFDALAQSIESYWSKNSTIVSRYYSRKAISLIIENFEKIVTYPKKDSDAIMKMLVASNYAGKAINITKTTGPHALSYGLTKDLNIPHGHSVAITLGAFFIAHNDLVTKNEKTVKKNLKLSNKVRKIIIKKTGHEPEIYLYELMKKFDLKFKIRDIGLTEEIIESLIKNINIERMSNHPIQLNYAQLKNIFFLIPSDDD